MRLTFLVEVELSHTTGKFVAKDEIADQLRDALESANLGTVDVDDSVYEVESWDVTDHEEPKPVKGANAEVL